MDGTREEKLTLWLRDVFAALNQGGRLAPARAAHKRIDQLLGGIGGAGLLRVATIMGIGEGKAVAVLAEKAPNLPEHLKTEEGQAAIEEWFEQNRDAVRAFRRCVMGMWKHVPPMAATRFSERGKDNREVEVWCRAGTILADGRVAEDQSNVGNGAGKP